MLRKSFAAIAAIALLAGSGAAGAQSAQPLSLNNAPALQRAGGAVEDASDLGGRRGLGIYIIGAIVLGAIIYGIIKLTDDDDPDSP